MHCKFGSYVQFSAKAVFHIYTVQHTFARTNLTVKHIIHVIIYIYTVLPYRSCTFMESRLWTCIQTKVINVPVNKNLGTPPILHTCRGSLWLWYLRPDVYSGTRRCLPVWMPFVAADSELPCLRASLVGNLQPRMWILLSLTHQQN